MEENPVPGFEFRVPKSAIGFTMLIRCVKCVDLTPVSSSEPEGLIDK